MHWTRISDTLPTLDRCSLPVLHDFQPMVFTSALRFPSTAVSCHYSISGFPGPHTKLFPREPPSKMGNRKLKEVTAQASELQAGAPPTSLCPLSRSCDLFQGI